MTKYESILDDAENANINIIENYPFESENIKGLYCNSTVALSNKLKSEAEKTCVLQEELGHHYTSYGNIIELNNAVNSKQEQIARLWAYNRLIGLRGIIDAYNANCHTKYEMAEYLNVTTDFLDEAIRKYTDKYGISTTIDNYVIYFIPTLGVMEMI